jgi:tetratricopeptide (TPR) repeat protein/predicted AlkP superfamily phosphohydrolase/phosphomutase
MKWKPIIFIAAIGLLIFGSYYVLKQKPHSQVVTATPAAAQQNKNNQALLKEIQDKKQQTNIRVMFIGWDAADWQIIDPLIQAGRMPNTQRLLQNGTRAYMRSTQPMLSPLLWNSIATGKHPNEHGILDFLVMDPKTNKPMPMNSTFRKSMALWNMLSEAGDTSAFVAWWATWPAEKTNGVMVTDRVSYSLFSSVVDAKASNGLTYPENYYSEIKPKLISEKDITNEQIAEFIHLTPAQIAEERTKQYPQGKTNPVAYMAEVLASTHNYYTIAIDLLSHQQYDLFSCYFEGIDQVGHLFQHMMPPKMDMVTDEEFRRYKDVVTLYYQYLDGLTGDLLKYKDDNTIVILMSDHGFKNGAERPTDVAPYINEKPAYWHRDYGIFLMSGGPIRKHAVIDTVTVYDAAPTILYLLGLPVGKDLPGNILADALEPTFGKNFPIHTIASWEPLKTAPEAAPQQASKVDSEVMENLSALGYIGNAEQKGQQGSGSETASYHRNLASIYINDKKYDLAEQEVRKSMQLGSIFETYELLFQVKKGQGKIDEAGAEMQEGFDKFGNVGGEPFLKLMNLYAENKKLDEGKQALQKYGSRLPSDSFRLYGSGRLKESAGDLQGAEADYLAALRQDPTFAYAMERLYAIYKGWGDLQKLEEPARAGLKINNQLALYHNVLGVVYKKQGRFQDAIAEYEKALSTDPDNSTYWANLSAAYLSLKQPEQALEFLLRAKNKNDQDPEIWLNLGAVYGSLGRNDEAIASFANAKQLAGDSPNIELGIAVSYAQKGDVKQALQITQDAVSRYPNSPELRELLSDLQSQQ